MFGVYVEPSKGTYIVMEYMEQGSLDQFIDSHEEKLTIGNLVDFACQGNKRKILKYHLLIYPINYF